ncbi:MAG: hypothetical protein NT075_00130, partial [Chloroflexi bacterium]|nr:hypothetical protein [Chloroflexota bacterium]
ALLLSSTMLTGTVATLNVGGVITITGHTLVSAGATGASLLNTASVTTSLLTATPTNTPTPTTTATSTATATKTPSATATPTTAATMTATSTATATKTPSATATLTPVNTPTPTATSTATATKTPSATTILTPVNTPTAAATNTATSTAIATATPTPVNIPTPTATSTATATKTPSATATPTPVNTPTAAATSTATSTAIATATPTPVSTAADLRISKRGSPNPALVGAPLTYTIIVTNAGPSAAQNVLIKDLLPDGVNFNGGSSIQVSNGASPILNITSNALTGTVATLNVGGVITITSQTLVSGNLTETSIRNTASVTTTTDNIPDNNTASSLIDLITLTPTATPTSLAKSTPVPATATAFPTTTETAMPAATPTPLSTTPDLQIKISHTPSQVAAGELLTYTIVISNVGNSTANNVVIQDVLPAGSTIQNAVRVQVVKGTGGDLTVANGVVTGWVTTLEPGGVVQITVQVRTNALGAETTLLNTAIVNANVDAIAIQHTALSTITLLGPTPTSTPMPTATGIPTNAEHAIFLPLVVK